MGEQEVNADAHDRREDTSYSIGELAALGGVSRRTVRYYVQRGLLQAPTGLGRGRHYTQRHLDTLIRIRKLQESVLPRNLDAPSGYRICARYEPAQIRGLGGHPESSLVSGAVAERKRELERLRVQCLLELDRMTQASQAAEAWADQEGVSPADLVRRCVGAVGPSLRGHHGVTTPGLVFDGLEPEG